MTIDIIQGDCLSQIENLVVERGEFADLIYLDPPFNSNRAFNQLVHDSLVHEQAYEDRWKLGSAAEDMLIKIRSQPKSSIRAVIDAFDTLLRPTDPALLAYLIAMGPRLALMKKALRPTGSIWLHCDPTASHYLKILMDQAYGQNNFLGEVIWKRTNANNNAKRPGPIHDVLLLYSKTDDYLWVPTYHAYKDKDLNGWREENGRLWKAENMFGPGLRGGDSGKPWRGIDPSAMNPPKNWAILSVMAEEYERRTKTPLVGTTQERLDALDAVGLIYWSSKGKPNFRMYKDPTKGVPLQSIWTDIHNVNSNTTEWVDFATQKPVKLLERIIRCSTHAGALVLDPYTGSGTTAVAAANLRRNFIGIEEEPKTVRLARERVNGIHPNAATTKIHDEPTDVQSAKQIAWSSREGKEAIELWSCRRIGAEHTGRPGDGGVDGNLTVIAFSDRKSRNVIIQVAAGQKIDLSKFKALANDRRDRNTTNGVENDEVGGAIQGIMIAFHGAVPSGAKEIVSRAGTFKVAVTDGVIRTYNRILILFIEDLFNRDKKDGGLPDLVPGFISPKEYSQTDSAVRRRETYQKQALQRQREADDESARDGFSFMKRLAEAEAEG